MKLVKTAFVVAALSVAATGVALAGNAKLTAPDGSKVTLKCTNSGCNLWKGSKRTKLGAGGSSNFKKQLSALKKKGYKTN